MLSAAESRLVLLEFHLSTLEHCSIRNLLWNPWDCSLLVAVVFLQNVSACGTGQVLSEEHFSGSCCSRFWLFADVCTQHLLSQPGSCGAAVLGCALSFWLLSHNFPSILLHAQLWIPFRSEQKHWSILFPLREEAAFLWILFEVAFLRCESFPDCHRLVEVREVNWSNTPWSGFRISVWIFF